MNESDNALIHWGFALAFAAYVLLAFNLVRQWYARRQIDRIGVAMLLAALFTAAWSGFSLLALDEGITAWWIAAQASDVLRYLCWGTFIALFFKQGSGTSGNWRRWLPGITVGGLAGVAMLVAARAFAGVNVATFAMMLLALGGLVATEQLLRNLPEASLWGAKPVCLGLAGTFLFDLYLYSQSVLFQGADQDAWNIRSFVHAVMMPLLLMATARHPNWIAKIRVSHRIVFHSATLMLAGLYLLFIAGVGYYVRYFGGDWGRALQLGLVFIALVFALVLALSGSVRARLRVFLGKNFFRYRFDYREEWLKFTATLSNQTHPSEAGQNVVRGLADMLESPAGMLWLLRPGDDQYRQVARWNLPPTTETEEENAELASFMRSTGWVVDLAEFRSTPARYGTLRLPEWLTAYPQAWLLVPLLQSQHLLGFVVLASPRTPVDVNWEVNDLLKTAGRQAASFLSQMQATEALLESRKFEAFSRMSAFVVHDLKNIVTQLSLMVKNAKRLQNNPEFQADMLMTVENSLDRMRQLIQQLRGDSAHGASSAGVDLSRIAERLAADAARSGRTVTVEGAPHVLTRGQFDRVERVIGHLVNNALDATGAEGRVWIKVDRFASHARVEVGDTGHGMTEEFIQTRLFKPFQTTKEVGMGIGAYESFQYVRELGGRLSVDSQVGRGTVITLLLPLIETSKDSDLHRLEAAQ